MDIRTNQRTILGSIAFTLLSILILYTNCGQKDGTGGGDFTKPGAPFISVWQTTLPNETLTLPLRQGFEYNMVVDWGDNTSKQTITSWDDDDKTHEYLLAGQHTITLRGLAEAWYFNNNGFSSCTDPGGGDEDKIISITNLGGMGWKSFERAFCGCDNLTSVHGGDTSDVTNMSSMFHGALNAEPHVANWDTSKVTDMSYMFEGVGSDLDVADWDTSKVTNMAGMFSSSSANADVSDWDTSKVTNMEQMFSTAAFNPNVSQWDTSKVTTMDQMFYLSTCNPNMDNWNLSSVSNMNSFLTGSNVSTAHYTELLKRIHETRTVNGVNLQAIGVQYYDSAASARASLITDNLWVISDNGSAGPDPM